MADGDSPVTSRICISTPIAWLGAFVLDFGQGGHARENLVDYRALDVESSLILVQLQPCILQRLKLITRLYPHPPFVRLHVKI
jgi:hypothetical protein